MQNAHNDNNIKHWEDKNSKNSKCISYKKLNNCRSGLKLSSQIIYSFILDDMPFQVSEYDCKISLKKN